MPVKTEIRGNAYWITIDAPKRKNAINIQMYEEMNAAMDAADEDENTFITVITGEGEYYSSGNDFSPAEMETLVLTVTNKDYESGYSKWMRRLIEHSKVLVALVNGPCIGIACTTLGLFDYVVCSDSAYFLTPFPEIGVCPEGASTKTFYGIMGTSRANEMLLVGQPMSAQKALECGFVAHVFPKAQFKQKTEEMVDKLCKLPRHSTIASKEICRGEAWKKEMKSVHDREYAMLRKLFAHDDTVALIMKKFVPKM